MTDKWSEVEDYLVETLIGPDPVLDSARAASESAGLPSIAVSPTEGKLLNLLARSISARTILEIGTLGGYSTIWLARALPQHGRLITLEVNPEHAKVAHDNIERAGFADLVDIQIGDARALLPDLVAQKAGPFDLVFIDADKANIPEYFTQSLELTRRGSLIIVDNVVRDGEVANAESEDPNIQGVRKLNELISANPRVSGTVIQTVGSKGYDGFAMVLVTA
jgi:predicted O-methyltransferase YrrM